MPKIVDQQGIHAGIFAAVLLQQQLELHGRHGVLAAFDELLVRNAFLKASAKLASHMLNVLDARWLLGAPCAEIVREVGPPFVQVATVEVVDAVEQRETRPLKGALAVLLNNHGSLPGVEDEALSESHSAVPLDQAVAEVTYKVVDDAAPVEEIVEMYPSFVMLAPPKIPMEPSTHVLWSGRVLCEDARLQDIPDNWPEGQLWISLMDVVDGKLVPENSCEKCWSTVPRLVAGLWRSGDAR